MSRPRPQVAQPTPYGKATAIQYRLKEPQGSETLETEQIQGKRYLFPGFEEFNLILLPPRGSKANRNKEYWRIVEQSCGLIIAPYAPIKFLEETLTLAESQLKVWGSKGLSNRIQEMYARIDPLLPHEVTIYGKPCVAIGRGKYPWDCEAKDQYPMAMSYYSDSSGFCTEFDSCFLSRNKTLDVYLSGCPTKS